MAVPIWSAPYVFTLTNPYSNPDPFVMNQWRDDGSGFMLDQKACQFIGAVRSTSQNVPQANGTILRRRFLTGVQMRLVIQMWASPDKVACDSQLAEMLDEAEGAFVSLLNAGDNEGRLSWEVAGQPERMIDDVRLLIYPEHTVTDAADVLTVTIDTKYPYAEELNQTATTITDGSSAVLDNTGTADFFPVFQVYDCATGSFTINNYTTGEQFNYVGPVLAGGPPPGGDYAELNSFDNTIYLNGDGADLLPYVDIASSLFPQLIIGPNILDIAGADMIVLSQPAFA